MPNKYHLVVGIDLGTTYSAVAAYNRVTEQSEILANTKEARAQTVPSVVSLLGGRVIVGEAARRNLLSDPMNTVIEIKREMGEEFRPETLVKFDAAKAGFRPRDEKAGTDGDPVRIQFNGEWMMPQELSAFVLMKMKQVAEAEIGEEIRDAVITVPAYFTEKQKKATEEAALLAGLYPRQLLAEPTAAAICYGVDRADPAKKNYLIYDLGGGTFDVSIISVEDTKKEVLATSGDPRLGGGDIDDLLTGWAVEQLRVHEKIDITGIPAKRAVVKYYAEKLKRDLSSYPTAEMSLPELRPQNPPRLRLSREEFEALVEPLLDRSLNFVDIALTQAEKNHGLKREQIDAILLVGGSSKIPRVKAKLLEYFQKDEKFVRADLDPDAVVARGAAVMALAFEPSPPPYDLSRKRLGGLNLQTEQDLTVQLITEHSLGIAVNEGQFHRIIDQGARIPISVTHTDFTNGGPARQIPVRVYQGEAEWVFQNTLIGTLMIGPMKEMPQGHHKFEVTFSLDVNGLLSMAVFHVNENARYEGKFEQKTGIGGVEKLAQVRDKLLKLYEGRGMNLDPTRVPPPPPPTVTATPNGAGAAPAAAAGAPPSASVPPPPPPTRPPPPPPPAPPAPAAGSGEVVEVRVAVSDQTESLLRRALKQHMKRPAPSLLAARNSLVRALNAGQTEEQVKALRDDLFDEYEDARADAP